MRSLIKPTIVLTCFTVIGQLIGFIINILSASFFGTNSEMEAYLVAQTIPVYISTVLVGGLGYVMIPMFIEKKSTIDENGAWDLASSIISLYLAFLIFSTFIGLVFSKEILNVFFPELPVATQLLALNLSFIFWPTSAITGFLTILAFIYQAYERFVYHAITTFIASAIYLLLFFIGAANFGIYALALASLLSSIIQLFLLLGFIKNKYSFRIKFTPEVIKLIKLQIPIIVAALFGQFSKIIDRSIASGLEVGSISYLSYADKIRGLLGVVLGSGLAITFFPTLIQNLVDKNIPDFKKSISLGMKITWLLVAPIVCFGSFFALPFVSLLFERGVFSSVDSMAVASVLPLFLISLIGATLGNVSSRSIYALKETKIIALTDIAGTLLYCFYAPILGNKFGIIGIGVAISILWNLGFLVHCVYIWIFLKRPNILNFIKSQMIILIVAFLSSYISYLVYSEVSDQGLASFIIVSLLGAILYSGLLYFIRVQEFLKLLAFFKLRIE